VIWDDRAMRSAHRLLRSSPVRRFGPAALYVALAGVTVAIVRGDPANALAGDSPIALAAELTAGAVLVTAAAALAARRPGGRFPALLAAAALAWPLTEWNSPGAGVAFTAGLLLYAAWPPLLAAAALRAPDERAIGRPATVLLVIAGVTSVGVMGLASAAVLDPLAQGCSGCPANRLLVVGDAVAWHDIGRAGLALTVVWAATLAALVSVRLASSSPARRRQAAPILIPAAVALALYAADAVHGLDRGFLANDPTDRLLWTGETAALLLVAAGVAWQRLRARRARHALAQLVVDLGASPSVGGLRERLAIMLDDPSLELLYGRDDSVGWIDAEGCATIPPIDHGRQTTAIVAAGREIAAIIHRRGLLDDPALADEIAAAARLGLEHERLHASRRAHLAELRASRARIVAAADAERRRLERDLHDGAQQRLVASALAVRLARRRLAVHEPALDDELAHAEHELNAAVGDLRELAHGLFPAVLAEEGLGAALDALAEHAPRLVPGALPDERFTTPIESVAYFIVAEALRLAPAGDLAVDARLHDDRLIVEVCAELELVGAPTRVEDRVGAAGGTLVAGPHQLRAELPCAS
jgi:signal transduction histidine kinase